MRKFCQCPSGSERRAKNYLRAISIAAEKNIFNMTSTILHLRMNRPMICMMFSINIGCYRVSACPFSMQEIKIQPWLPAGLEYHSNFLDLRRRHVKGRFRFLERPFMRELRSLLLGPQHYAVAPRSWAPIHGCLLRRGESSTNYVSPSKLTTKFNLHGTSCKVVFWLW